MLRRNGNGFFMGWDERKKKGITGRERESASGLTFGTTGLKPACNGSNSFPVVITYRQFNRANKYTCFLNGSDKGN